jgi:hypothetical protein
MKNFTIGIGKGTLSMMKRFSWLTLVIVLVVAIAVTGCGGGGGKKKNNDTNGSDGNDDGGTMVLEFDTEWDVDGEGILYGVAVDSQGYVYVTTSSEIIKFSSIGIPIATWEEDELGNFINGSFGVAVSSDRIYVANKFNAEIMQFPKIINGISNKWGSKGDGDGQFNNPMGVAVDKNGKVYVADSGNNRIQIFRYNEDDGIFELSDKWNVLGYPIGVAVDSLGNVYVARNNSQLIQKFDKEGNSITEWGGLGSEEGQFRNPSLIAVDKDDNIYVADTNNDRIQKFNSVGSFLMQWGSSGSGGGQFYGPTGVAVDQDGNVYVADSDNNRIQKFKWVKK